MIYSFSGSPAQLTGDRVTVFWGAAPHRVTDVEGVGLITNIYLSLGQFVRLGLPTELVDAVLSGAVIASLMHAETEPGHYTGWIAPPRQGIDNLPGDFEYVKIGA